MTTAPRELPAGWAWASPGDVASALANALTIGPFGSDLKVSDYRPSGVPLVFVKNIRSEDLLLDRKFIDPDKAEQLKRHVGQPGDILVTKMGDPPGDCCFFPTEQEPAVITADCIKWTPHAFIGNPRYFLYALRSPLLKAQVAALTGGVAQQKISLQKFRGLQFPTAPAGEQQRIVAELDKHFTRLDAAVVALKRVQVQLKRYRASALRVTQDSDSWTREGKDWQTATVATLAEAVVDCPHSTATFQPKGCACLDTNNIQPGRVVTERLRFVSQAVFIDRIRRLRPRPGDVVFAREGTVGTAVRLPEVPLVCLGQRVMLIRPGSGVGSSFLQWALMAPQTKAQYRSKLLGSTVPHLNVADVKALRLAVPAVEEQHLIVEQVELHWSLADAIEVEVESAIRRSGLLRQSLLALAFSGRLVPQDPSDEPAAALLERIRAERQRTPSKTRKPRPAPSVEQL